MSYYVKLEIAWGNDEGFDPSSAKARKKVFSLVEEYLRNEDAEGREGRLDWLEEFRAAFSTRGEASIKLLEQEWLTDLLLKVSARLPGVKFWARGIGEEFTDVWVIEACDGQIEWAASLKGARQGAPRLAESMPPWPGPLEPSRVIREAGLLKFVGQILEEQPSSAEVGALVLKRVGQRKPRALIYVGPLSFDGYERIGDLLDPMYRPQLYRDARSLLSYPVATAEKPLGH